jgi:hypothetical protein
MNPTPELAGDGVCRSDDWLPRLTPPRPDPSAGVAVLH